MKLLLRDKASRVAPQIRPEDERFPGRPALSMMALLGGAALIAARRLSAQQKAMPVIGTSPAALPTRLRGYGRLPPRERYRAPCG
jgi:hypothetical protein